MTLSSASSQRIEELITFVLKLTADPDFPIGSVGRTRLMKYIFLADLAYAERNAGQTYTGAEWRFLHYGPWAAAVQDAIEPAMAKFGAHSMPFKDDGEDVPERSLWHAKGVQLPQVNPPVVTQLAIERAAKAWPSTPELLQHVYLTKPMLRAAPGELLDFRQTTPPVAPVSPPQLTVKQQKKRKEAIAAARERVRQLRENRKPDAQWVDVHPTYDDEFARVTEMLESSNGPQQEPFDAEATFDESVWKSGVRGGEIP